MKIGIDIDNVITKTFSKTLEYIEKCDNKEELLNNIKAITTGDNSVKCVDVFYKKNSLKVFEQAELMEGAKENIDRLLEDGHEIIIITLRGDKLQEYKGSEKITLDYFKKYDIKYNKIIFSSIDKVKDCKENNIDILIDDSVSNCIKAEKEGINAIIFNTETNKNIDDRNIKRVTDWNEIYEEILKMSNSIIR